MISDRVFAVADLGLIIRILSWVRFFAVFQTKICKCTRIKLFYMQCLYCYNFLTNEYVSDPFVFRI